MFQIWQIHNFILRLFFLKSTREVHHTSFRFSWNFSNSKWEDIVWNCITILSTYFFGYSYFYLVFSRLRRHIQDINLIVVDNIAKEFQNLYLKNYFHNFFVNQRCKLFGNIINIWYTGSGCQHIRVARKNHGGQLQKKSYTRVF